MNAPEDKVLVELDAEMVARTRAELGLADESDTAVIERALNAYHRNPDATYQFWAGSRP